MSNQDENDKLRNGETPKSVGENAVKDTSVLRPEDIENAIPRVVERNIKRQKRFITPVPFPKEWEGANFIDYLHGAWWPGSYILVGGTGTGKTQFAMQAALAAAEEGNTVIYVAMELSEDDLINRILALKFNKTPAHMDGREKIKDWEKRENEQFNYEDEDVQKELKRLRDLPFKIITASSKNMDYESITEVIRRIEEENKAKEKRKADKEKGEVVKKPPFIIVDFLQLVTSPDDDKGNPIREDLRQRIQRASYQINDAARDYDAVVLNLSSTARTSYKELTKHKISKEKIPQKKDESLEKWEERKEKQYYRPTDEPASTFIGLGKEAGEIEYSAHALIVLAKDFTTEKKDGKTIRHFQTCIGLAKNRNGRTTEADGDGLYGNNWDRFEFKGGRLTLCGNSEPKEPGKSGESNKEKPVNSNSSLDYTEQELR